MEMANGTETRKVGKGHPPVEHQFKPGNPGGPGRPKEKPLTDALRKALAADDGKAIEALIKKGLAKARAGDFRFWKEIVERIDGKVLEQMDVTSAGEPLGVQLPEEEAAAFYRWKAKQAKPKA